MFEASLLPERRGKDARLIRGIAFGCMALQVIALTAFVMVPLIHPDKLPDKLSRASLTHVELKRPEPKPVLVKPQLVRVTNNAAISAPAHREQPVVEIRRGGMISRAPVTDAAPALALGGGNVMGAGFNAAVGFGSATGKGDSPVVVAAKPMVAAAAGPVRVSSGVSRGLLIDPIRPLYPAIAQAARQEGTVTVTAVIDRSGRIVNAQVIDGPVMLREAAITAVREARYRPFLLNGQPTEVVTTVAITFRISG